MRIKSKITIYFQSITKLAVSNPIRTALTAAGIFVSVFLFSTGFILANSYYTGTMSIVGECAKESIVLSTVFADSDPGSELQKIAGGEYCRVMELYSRRCLLSVPMEGGFYFNHTAHVYGVDSTEKLLPITDDDGRFIPTIPELIEGRMLNETDAAHASMVAVIDRFTADLLFEEGSAVGKTVVLKVNLNGDSSGMIGGDSLDVSLEVIGVVEPSRLQKSRMRQLKRQIDSPKSNVIYESSVWCPITAFGAFHDYDPSMMKWMILSEDERYPIMISAAAAVSELYDMHGKPFEIQTRESLIGEIETQQAYIQTILRIVMGVLVVLSGVGVMSITVFAVKERIPEIGIRKAFGAAGMDIAFQIVLEMLILAFAISIVSVCISFFACKGVELYVRRKMLLDFSVIIPTYKLALPLLLGLLEAFLFSIIPSVYAARISVADALRFE